MSSTYISDKSLLSGFIAGSEDNFEALVLRHQAELFQFALYMAEDPELAEDVVIQTFFKVYSEAESFLKEGSIRGTLFKTVLDFMIARAEDDVLGEFEQRIPQYFRELPEVTLYEDFLEAVFKLPPKYRLVFLLRDTFGFNSEEVQDMLNLSRSNLRRIVYRARLMMRRTLLLLGSFDVVEEGTAQLMPHEVDAAVKVLM